MSVTLKLQWPLTPTPGPVTLKFGDASAPEIDGVIQGALPPPALQLSGTLTGIRFWDIPDADGPGLCAPQRQSQAVAAPLLAAQQHMLDAHIPAAACHTHADPIRVPLALAQQHMQPLRHRSTLPAQHGIRVTGRTNVPHAETIKLSRRAALPAQHGIRITAHVSAPHAETVKLSRFARLIEQQGIRLASPARACTRQGLRVAVRRSICHQQARPLPVGLFPYVPLPPEPPPPLDLRVTLRFCRLTDGTTVLRFGCPGVAPPLPPGHIPIREVYIVLNTVNLTLTDGTEIPARGLNVAIDADSWAWSWSATIPGSAAHLVAGEHVEVLAHINGQTLRLLVEQISRNRRFAENWYTLRGRSPSALLADPYAPQVTRDNAGQALTAQQLITQALTVNGVPVGWDVDWELEDWSVPAGVWSHTGTHIDAVLRVAEAGGGYVQTHMNDARLLIQPRYPIAPWHWASEDPAIVLPEDVCDTEAVEWTERPDYNAVWVSGQSQGRRDRIRKTGGAAGRYAPSIVDPLATSTIMTRQRGLAVLGDTGRQAHITVRLPVLPETGIILPGQLIEYTALGQTHRGITRGVDVRDDRPNLWQSVRIESHE